MMKKTNCVDGDAKKYLRDFEAKIKEELEYMNKLDAEREKQMSSRAAVEYLRPNKSPPIYIHKNIVNFKTSCLISSLAERRKNIFKQYMDFQEILDEDIEGGIYNRRIPLSFTIFQNETMRKYSNEFSSGCTLHEKIPQEKYSSLVTPVNKTIKKYKSTYNRSKKPLRGFRSQLTRTGDGEKVTEYE